MSHHYRAVNWNRQKRIYDGGLGLGVIGSVGIFAAVTLVAHPSATAESILIRGFGLTAFLLLHFILVIGPAARLDPRFLPLLYNRRHLGVTLGLLALAHSILVLVQYHAFGNTDPVVSLLTANPDWTSLAGFPFEIFGVIALVVLSLMAVTSHDYWLAVLTPPVWKRLHMLVYVAYVSLVLHVGLGFLQDERHPLYAAALAVGVLLVGGLHVAASIRERAADREASTAEWVPVCRPETIIEGRARIATVGGERVAVFKHQGRLSAVTNVCKHQGGPLGEGRIVDGCITCPWHGYQFRPEDGRSPPPFEDSIPTSNLRVTNGLVLVQRTPNPAGTAVEPVASDSGTGPNDDEPFYVGYQPQAPTLIARFTKVTAGSVLILAGCLMSAMAAGQRTFGPSAYEFGTTRTVVGTIRAAPFPVVEVADSGAKVRRYLLAAAGKFGAQQLVGPFDGQLVRITGQLAYRGNGRLLEIATVATADGAPAPIEPVADLGTFRLDGEIVDSKCYLGVMNPGLGKTHRGCAARCLSGGMTPLFTVRNFEGAPIELIMVNERMGPLPRLNRIAGRPLGLTGRVLRQGDLWFFQVTRGLPES